MKAKRLEKKDVNTKTTQRCVIKEETEVLGVKPLRYPPSAKPSKPNLPDVPKPSKPLLQQGYSKLCLI